MAGAAMKQTIILFPVLLQVMLTLGILMALGPTRARSMREHRQQLGDTDVRLGQNSWSEQATKVAKCYQNQFELPVLFFAVVAFALQAGAVDNVMLSLAWIFAVSRVVQAVIHIGPNIIVWRGLAFLAGAVALAGLWVKLALHIL
jgi:hypothetical protein